MHTLAIRVDDEVLHKLKRITEKIDPTLKNKSHVIRELIHERYYKEFHDTLNQEKIDLLSILDDENNAKRGWEIVKEAIIKNHEKGAAKTE